jgi:hypothetical protein
MNIQLKQVDASASSPLDSNTDESVEDTLNTTESYTIPQSSTPIAVTEAVDRSIRSEDPPNLLPADEEQLKEVRY